LEEQGDENILSNAVEKGKMRQEGKDCKRYVKFWRGWFSRPGKYDMIKWIKRQNGMNNLLWE
jgi:hypothetical protein